jgi:hypothetical protein
MKSTHIQQALRCTEEESKLALSLMKLDSGVEEFVRKARVFPRTCNWIDQCYHTPSHNEIVLSALDELLATFGVECIETSEVISNYHGYARASYLNTGDSYAKTILLDHKELTWRLVSWGDFVEEIGHG